MLSFRMGTASDRTAIFYYIIIVLSKTIAQGMSNLSMTQINYPAKVLFKSTNPIITMVIGIAWFGKSYPRRDYAVVRHLYRILCTKTLHYTLYTIR